MGELLIIPPFPSRLHLMSAALCPAWINDFLAGPQRSAIDELSGKSNLLFAKMEENRGLGLKKAFSHDCILHKNCCHGDHMSERCGGNAKVCKSAEPLYCLDVP